MKIVCDACLAKYSIADEKVQDKAFKIRCKNCNHIIVVRSGGARSPGGVADPKPASAGAQGTWYIIVEGEQVGPLAEPDIARRMMRSETTGEILVWKEGLADWTELSAVPELAEARLQQATAAVQPGSDPASRPAMAEGLRPATSRPIASLKDYVGKTTQILAERIPRNSTRQIWFRGQASSDWHLRPGIYRRVGLAQYEREMLRDFRMRAPQFLQSKPSSDIEWLFVMQHHGVPTRLLDWTDNPMVALFFALTGGEWNEGAHPVVWALDPWCLNSQTIGRQSIPTADDPALVDYALPRLPTDHVEVPKARWPAAIRPTHVTDRIAAQSGVFTIHGHAHNGLEEPFLDTAVLEDPKRWYLRGILIDGTASKDILRELYAQGVSHASLFPGLDGLSSSIAYRYSDAYMNDRVEGAAGHGSSDFPSDATNERSTILDVPHLDDDE